MLLDIRQFHNEKIVVDMDNASSLKDSDYLGPGAPTAENSCIHASSPHNCHPGNLDESEDKTLLDHLLAPLHQAALGPGVHFSEPTHLIKLV